MDDLVHGLLGDASRHAEDDRTNMAIRARDAAARIVALEAERDRLAAAGNNLAAHLNQLNTEQYDRRYTPGGPCSGCYDAVIEWNALRAAGSTDSSTP